MGFSARRVGGQSFSASAATLAIPSETVMKCYRHQDSQVPISQPKIIHRAGWDWRE